MKKIIFIGVILLVIGVSSTSAQIVWGLRAGLSHPTISAGENSMNGKFGLEVGPTLYYSLKNNIYINSGLMFSTKTFKSEFDWGDGNYSKDELSMSYLDIPLYIGYRIPVGNLHTYAQAGPYIGVNLSSKYKWSENDRSYPYSGTVNFANSFNAGFGIMYGININRFKIEIGYQYGFTNISKYKDDYIVNIEDFSLKIGSFKLSSLFLGISYVF